MNIQNCPTFKSIQDLMVSYVHVKFEAEQSKGFELESKNHRWTDGQTDVGHISSSLVSPNLLKIFCQCENFPLKMSRKNEWTQNSQNY